MSVRELRIRFPGSSCSRVRVLSHGLHGHARWGGTFYCTDEDTHTQPVHAQIRQETRPSINEKGGVGELNYSSYLWHTGFAGIKHSCKIVRV